MALKYTLTRGLVCSAHTKGAAWAISQLCTVQLCNRSQGNATDMDRVLKCI
jgi:hypothetical protein